MVNTTEGEFALHDGTKLYTKTWVPDSPPAAHLVAVHGFSDHCNAYYTLFPTLASPPYNIQVHSFDQRGWGRSAAQKSQWGLTGPTAEVIDDLHQFACHVASNVGDGKPLFLFGHSMGGGEALCYLLGIGAGGERKLPSFAGLVLESPYIALPPESAPSPFVVFAGRLAGKVMPKMQMVQKLDASFMCRDPKVCEDWKNDPLCHDTGTLQGLSGLLDRAAALEAIGVDGGKLKNGRVAELPCPVFWGHGDADKVCSYDKSERTYGAMEGQMKEGSCFRRYDGGYHKLHAEPDGMGETFTREIGDFMMKVMQAGGEMGAKPKL